MRKTILISIFHGHTARNLLRTRVLDLLKAEKNLRVVLVVPAFKKDFYEREFGGGNVVIEPAPPIRPARLDRFFRRFYYFFVDTETVHIVQRQQTFARVLTKIFGHLRPLRELVRLLDRWLVPDLVFGKMFDAYHPDLVFVPSITSDDECLLLRQARARGIPGVGMVRSWDNLTVNKGNIRIKPDKLLVHNEIMKQEAIRYGDMVPSRVEVVGLSHFDHYLEYPTLSREAFFASIGADPAKRMIFLTLIGLSAAALDQHVITVLEHAIKTDPALRDCFLLARTHPNENKTNLHIDPAVTLINIPKMMDFSSVKLTDREFTKEDMAFLANALAYTSVLVNTQSTTTLDAAAFDVPVVNVAFDEASGKLYAQSVRRFYDYTHYVPVLKSGGVKVARTEKELVDDIAAYLKDPSLDREGRKRMLAWECDRVDGHASERTVRAILSMLCERVIISPQIFVSREDAWFWSPEWQAMEREADEDFAAGRFHGPYRTKRDLQRVLDRLKRK